MSIEKIVFVGVHFKKGFKALDARTATGRIVDMISCRVHPVVEKVNIFPTEYLPLPAERWDYSEQFEIEDNALYVGLGRTVNDHLKDVCKNHLPVHHPGYVMRKGKAAIRAYVKDVVKQIGFYTCVECNHEQKITCVEHFITD